MDRYLGQPVSSADLVWVLGSLARLHRRRFNAELLLQLFPPPHAVASLIAGAQALDFDPRLFHDTLDRLTRADPPCVAVLAAPSADATEATPDAPSVTAQLVLLTGLDAGQVQYFAADAPQPKSAPRAEFERTFTGELIHFTVQPAAPQDTDALQQRPTFGFRWFIPELLKHRKIWRDVLAASLAIQILALATPLFTQVIIDKVVVHQTMSTLSVVGLGLVMLLLFSAAMSWARQYLILHTGNCVDAVLGTQVFDHLLKLPLRYFEHRPTGVVITRVHAVETIREFVTGAAVALVSERPGERNRYRDPERMGRLRPERDQHE